MQLRSGRSAKYLRLGGRFDVPSQLGRIKQVVVAGRGRWIGGQQGHLSDRACGHPLEKEVNWQQTRDGLHCPTRRGAEHTCDPQRSFALHLAEGLDVALAAGPIEIPQSQSVGRNRNDARAVEETALSPSSSSNHHLLDSA